MLEIKINTDNIFNLFVKQMGEISNAVLYGLVSIDSLNNLPDNFQMLNVEDSFLNFFINDPGSENTHKKMYKNWLIKKGFEDLKNVVVLLLVEVYVVLKIINNREKISSCDAFHKDLEQYKKKALAKKNFRDLIKDITNEQLANHLKKENLIYLSYVDSMRRIRNCLVHRGGIVTERDVNVGDNCIKLEWLGLGLFFREGDKEVEATRGYVVKEAGGEIKRDVKREKKFKIGEKIDFSYREFNEFLNTCHLFGINLIQNLHSLISGNKTKCLLT